MTTTDWHVVKDRFSRIGRLRLYRHATEDRWAVSLDNRTYHKFHEIPPERVARWLREFNVSPDRRSE